MTYTDKNKQTIIVCVAYTYMYNYNYEENKKPALFLWYLIFIDNCYLNFH